MPDITLVLHNIRSTYNVGAILRTAEGFGVKKVICSGYTPYPKLASDTRLPHLADKITARIHKTALGAETMLTVEYCEQLEKWIDKNQQPLIALEQSPVSTNIAAFTPPEQYALLLGEEVNGIASEYLHRCDSIVEIPMYGQKESFNVSVATGIALFSLHELCFSRSNYGL